jgi:hypothetical protein
MGLRTQVIVETWTVQSDDGGNDMNRLFSSLLLALAIGFAGAADATKLVPKTSDSYDVYCGRNDEVFVGTMYWNGTQWSDGLRWHKDKEELAKLMVAAQGSACDT